MTRASRSTTEAELRVIADSIDRYRDRLASLAQSSALGVSPDGAEDLVAAIHEAERALRSAHRHVTRAVKLSG